jgi:hypothetical protein
MKPFLTAEKIQTKHKEQELALLTLRCISPLLCGKKNPTKNKTPPCSGVSQSEHTGAG